MHYATMNVCDFTLVELVLIMHQSSLHPQTLQIHI